MIRCYRLTVCWQQWLCDWTLCSVHISKDVKKKKKKSRRVTFSWGLFLQVQLNMLLQDEAAAADQGTHGAGEQLLCEKWRAIKVNGDVTVGIQSHILRGIILISLCNVTTFIYFQRCIKFSPRSCIDDGKVGPLCKVFSSISQRNKKSIDGETWSFSIFR